MHRATRRSGLLLVLGGLLGVGFFWLTDPKWGITGSDASHLVDAINQAWPGTYIGMAGGIVIAVIGLWLMTRRMA